jgi:N-acyl-phosphatidylethanolamine-hydrolysing phospholipase D
MISHNYYDYLDLSTIETIFKKFPKARYFVPLGNKGWICLLGIPQNRVHELDWWQNREYRVQDFRYTIPIDSGLIFIVAGSVLVSGHEQLLL